jgi:hypothetical protein
MGHHEVVTVVVVLGLLLSGEVARLTPTVTVVGATEVADEVIARRRPSQPQQRRALIKRDVNMLVHARLPLMRPPWTCGGPSWSLCFPLSQTVLNLLMQCTCLSPVAAILALTL